MTELDFTNIDMRTPKERERDKRNERICRKYIDLRTAYPDAKVGRICAMIAVNEPLEAASIRKVLKDKHLI
mgnify:CR=1 FL=1